MYYCECCDYSTDKKSNLTRHESSVKHQKLSKSYHKVTSLNVHSVTPKSPLEDTAKFKCKYCQKAFKYALRMCDHVKYSCKKNTGKKFNKYYCSTCDYQAKQKSHFDKHLSTLKHHKAIQNHEDDSPPGYCCKYCAKSFSTKQSMYRHMKNSCGFYVSIYGNNTRARFLDIYLQKYIALELKSSVLQEQSNKLQQELSSIQNKIDKIKTYETIENTIFDFEEEVTSLWRHSINTHSTHSHIYISHVHFPHSHTLHSTFHLSFFLD